MVTERSALAEIDPAIAFAADLTRLGEEVLPPEWAWLVQVKRQRAVGGVPAKYKVMLVVFAPQANRRLDWSADAIRHIGERGESALPKYLRWKLRHLRNELL